MTAKKSCDQCKFSLGMDYGYSNYTTEGTTQHCMIGAHPSSPEGFDRFYGTDERIFFAEECPRFEEGDGIALDVEMEGVDELTPEQRALYDAWCDSADA